MIRRVRLLAVMCVCLVPLTGAAHVCATHTYLGNNPSEGNPGWHQEVQGLAHDADYWYITQNPAFRISPFDNPPTLAGGPRLWRVPVTHDLGADADCGSGSVSCGDLRVTALLGGGYNHYGDPDVYEFGGRGYVLVPIEGGVAGVAIFRADATLQFLASAPFPGQTHSSWVAVDATGRLLSSDFDDVAAFNRFTLDWAAFQASGEQTFSLQLESVIPVLDEAGAALTLQGAQGGEYSDDWGRFYFAGTHDGLHVFEERAGAGAECAPAASCTVAQRVERSHNGPGGFAFEFNDSSSVSEEPEGLTFWDLDADGRAPGLRGQLHVVLLDNDLVEDDAYVKHYRLSGDIDPPAVACPADAVAECSVTGGVPAPDAQLASFFAGATATDACEPTPSISHDAPSLFALGQRPVTFTAQDHAANAASCVARVTVVDTRAPDLVCPAAAIVECTGPQGIAASDPQLTSFFSGATAADICDAAPTLANNAPATIPTGTAPVTFTATDATGNARACQVAVTVADTAAPSISVALSATTLWPANHKLVPITATVTTTDRCDPNVVLQLVSVTSSEPDNGSGDGDTANDIQGAIAGTADRMFSVRAERSGSGAGRVYTIVYRATDAAGNSTTATAHVQVPHNR